MVPVCTVTLKRWCKKASWCVIDYRGDEGPMILFHRPDPAKLLHSVPVRGIGVHDGLPIVLTIRGVAWDNFCGSIRAVATTKRRVVTFNAIPLSGQEHWTRYALSVGWHKWGRPARVLVYSPLAVPQGRIVEVDGRKAWVCIA
jgi:hypothetical protein